MNKKIKIILCLVVCLSFILSSTLFVFASYNGRAQVNVNQGSYLNLRSEPSTSSSIVHKLYNDEWVYFLIYPEPIPGGWVPVETDDGYQGYVQSKYLDNEQF